MNLQKNFDNNLKNKEALKYDYPVLRIERTFRAPVQKVWNAMSEVELLKQWWGPEGFTSPSAKNRFSSRREIFFSYARS